MPQLAWLAITIYLSILLVATLVRLSELEEELDKVR